MSAYLHAAREVITDKRGTQDQFVRVEFPDEVLTELVSNVRRMIAVLPSGSRNNAVVTALKSHGLDYLQLEVEDGESLHVELGDVLQDCSYPPRCHRCDLWANPGTDVCMAHADGE